MSLLTYSVQPESVRAANSIRLIIDGPLALSVSVNSLETFSQTGELEGNLHLLGSFLSDDLLDQFRQGLQTPISVSAGQISNLTYSSLGRDVLQNVGKVIRISPELNGFLGLRGALIKTAAKADPEGWTVIEVLREFPTQQIDLQVGDLLSLRKELEVYFDYNQAVVKAIQEQANVEAGSQAQISLSNLIPLSQKGKYSFQTQTITVTNPALRQTSEGFAINYDFTVNAYIPQGLDQPAPIVIISHGFGDVKESFEYLAEHLASYGFVVLVPNHVGSNLETRQNFLDGFLNTILSPSEFISRPREISFLIDQLEQSIQELPEWESQLNLEQIGVIGDSLGGATVLALAGAQLDFSHLQSRCDPDTVNLNFALYLQCQARFLPPQDFNLADPRIKAAIAIHPLGAGLYGPQAMSQIETPFMMISGSQDIVSPTTVEQIHPFIWIGSEQKYLALITEGTHFTAKPGRESAGGFFKLLAGENREIGSQYAKALSVAFLRAHLQEQSDYLPYLTARYGQKLSEGDPLRLDIIQSLDPQTLIAAYGGSPPIEIIPTSDRTPLPPRTEKVLDEIKRTGVLTVAIREDAAPLGYVDQEGNWRGYCREIVTDLQKYLSQILKLGVDIDLVELHSTLDNRFSLVQSGVAHLECGPNTIRQDVTEVIFSSTLLVAGTQLLVKSDQFNPETLSPGLDNLRVAILPETATASFMRETYPQAELIPFPGPGGRSDAVEALSTGQIDMFASDGILLTGELIRQNKDLDSYTLFPVLPLTCDYYGLILPSNDPQWKKVVDIFLMDLNDRARKSSSPEVEKILASQASYLDYCLNQ